MNIRDYIILAVIALALAAAVIYIVRRKKSENYFCGGNCSGCKNNCEKKSPK